ncbi:MAG: M14 family zinc carboxypeptidase, partial [Gemmatimonadota bacterium]
PGGASAAVQATDPPQPAEIFGFEPGADYRLADYPQMLEYFTALSDASDRVALDTIGRSVLGRPMVVAYVSSAENLRELDRMRTISERLARGEPESEAVARRLASEGKAVVWIDAGLHATEVAPAQHMPLLAYEVVTAETDEIRRIRENVILLLNPVLNPDGLDIVVDWYERNVGTPYETSGLPWLYHHYTGHDNNRDWFMITQPETQAASRVWYHEWYPQIVYNHHQTAPFPTRIFLPPFADPMNPNIPPLVVRGVNHIGTAMAERFTREGKPGAVSRRNFSMWWNGGARTAPYYHNMHGILTETALYRYATPGYYDPDELDAGEPSVLYPDPWEGGWWRLRDAVEYCLTASLAVLDIGAERKEDWLYNAWLMARQSIERGEAGEPFAFVFPADEQWDMGETVNLMNVLRRGGAEVHRAAERFEADGREYPAGSYVVYTAQAFRPWVVDLLEAQRYPEGRDRPYDITGWTLSMQVGTAMDRIDRPFDAEVEPVDVARVPSGRIEGNGDWGYLLTHRWNASAVAVNRLLGAGERVSWAGAAFEIDGREHAAGTIVIRAGDRSPARVRELATGLGLDFVAIDEAPDAPLHALRGGRVGLYKSWDASMDEGWTRFVLEQYGFPVDTLHDHEIRDGDLSGYDAIILPSQNADDILNGHAPGTMPPEYVGGLGVEGAAALKRYVEDGGTVVALDAATEFAIRQFGLPVRGMGGFGDAAPFAIPGSLIRIDVDTTSPLAWGMPDEAAAFFSNSRAFAVVDPAEEGDAKAPAPPVEVVARYAEDDLLMSGWARGEEFLAGRPAVLRVGLGEGDVVLIGFRAQFRAQPRGTFKLLFNPLHGAGVEDLP